MHALNIGIYFDIINQLDTLGNNQAPSTKHHTSLLEKPAQTSMKMTLVCAGFPSRVYQPPQQHILRFIMVLRGQRLQKSHQTHKIQYNKYNNSTLGHFSGFSTPDKTLFIYEMNACSPNDFPEFPFWHIHMAFIFGAFCLCQTGCQPHLYVIESDQTFVRP